MQRASDFPGVSIFADKINDRARSAMNELCKIGFGENNVWHQHKEHRYEILDDIEYLKQFGRVDATLMEIVRLVEVGELQTLPSFDFCRNQNSMYTMDVFEQGLQIEASRDMALIKISPTKLVELLMDVVSFRFLFLFCLYSFSLFLQCNQGLKSHGTVTIATVIFELSSNVFYATSINQRWAVVAKT